LRRNRRPRKIVAVHSAARFAPRVATPACPAAADAWNGSNGNWETSASWSNGVVPTATDYVCIPSGSVTVNSLDTVAGLLLDSGATISIQSGGLTLAGGTLAGGTPSPISGLAGQLTVASGASLSVGAPATLLNASGGSIVNQGTVQMLGIFEQDAGTVATASGDQPVQLLDGSSLVFTGTGAGTFLAEDGSATENVGLSGNLAAGQSLELASPGNCGANQVATLTATGSFTNAGTITLDHRGTAGCGGVYRTLTLPAGATLTNTGTINTSGSGAGASYDETIDGNLANQGTLGVGVNGQYASHLVLPAGRTLTNTGTITIRAAAGSTDNAASALTANGAVSNGTGGTIANHGTVQVSGSFTQGAGTTSDQPVQLLNGSSLAFTGTGAGAFLAEDGPGAEVVGLSGDLASGQTLELASPGACGANQAATLAATGSFTNAGTITLDHRGTAGCGGETRTLTLPNGATLTNTGTISTSGSGQGASYPETINGNLTNQGTLNVGVSGHYASHLVLAAGRTLTNTGSITVLAAAGATDTAASALTANGAVSNGTGGTIANHGTVQVSGSFTQGAGTTSDQPVQLLNGSSLAFTGTGAGTFLAEDGSATETVGLSGDLAAGQSVELATPGACGANQPAKLVATGSFTNAGTITLDHRGTAGCGGEYRTLTLPPNATLTNTGTINTSGSGQGASYPETIDANLTNQGTLNVGINGRYASHLVLPAGRTLTNTGTITIRAAAGSTDSAVSTLTADGPVIAASGTIDNEGTFAYSGPSFTEENTTITGAPVPIDGGKLTFAGTGASSFVVSPGQAASVAGSIAADQTLTIDATGNAGGPSCRRQPR
jgi:hypothetical protein